MIKDLCFEIISACPNNCKFCSSESSIACNHIVTLDMFKKTIDTCVSKYGVESISLSGGEPFLHPDLFDIVKYCKDKGIHTTIYTSGLVRRIPFDAKIKEKLKDYEVLEY